MRSTTSKSPRERAQGQVLEDVFRGTKITILQARTGIAVDSVKGRMRTASERQSRCLSSWASAERNRSGERKIGQIGFTIPRVGPIPSNTENLPLGSISVLTLLLNYEH